MALQFTHTIGGTSLEVENCYAKINRIVCIKNGDVNKIEVAVSIYSSKKDRTELKKPLDSFGVQLSSDSVDGLFEEFFPKGFDDINLFEKSYEYLKTLLLFVDAIDV